MLILLKRLLTNCASITFLHNICVTFKHIPPVLNEHKN